jgi:DNA-binding NtrC family response regulator
MMDHSMNVIGVRPPLTESQSELRLQKPAPMFMGHSPAARRVQSQIHRAVRSNLPVLLVGAPGTGKHTIARILHHFGGGESLELDVVSTDGFARIRPMGAMAYIPRLEDLPLEEQARLPGLAGMTRLILGTEIDPDSELGRQKLDPRVLRWVGGLRIVLPRLSDRIEDLESLATSILHKTPSRRPIGGISDSALDCLRSYTWPENVDELESVLREAILSGTGDQIELRDLPVRLRVRDVRRVRAESPERKLCLEEAEKQAIRRALHYTHGNKRKAARLLHIGKTTLYRKLKAYDLE